MTKFYAVAEGKNNQSLRINFDNLDKQPQNRFEAEQIAIDYGKKQGLHNVNTYIAKGTQKQGSTLTKFFKYRKKNNGKNPKDFHKFL